MLAEVLYNAGMDSDMLQWAKLYNPCEVALDLSGYVMSWAGADYVFDPRLPLELQGTIDPGGCVLIGGPTANATNGNPQYDFPLDLAPDLRDGVGQASGIALFDVPAAMLDATTVPIDAVVYGDMNAAGLIDESGQPVMTPAPGHAQGESLKRVSAMSGDWMASAPPTPGECPTF